MFKKLAVISVLLTIPFTTFADLSEKVEEYKREGTINQNFKDILFDKEFKEEMLPELLESGLDGNYDTGENVSNFHLAVRKLSAKGLELFLSNKSRIEVNQSNQLGLTILGDAIFWGGNNSYEKAKLLIEKFGADVNFRGTKTLRKAGFTSPYQPIEAIPSNRPIHYVQDVKTLDLLVGHGADINAEGETIQNITLIPIFSAVRGCHLDVLKRLVELRANKANRFGTTCQTIRGECSEDQQKPIYEYVDSLFAK